MRHLIASDNLQKTQPLIDEDQNLALLHAPLTGTIGELAKLEDTNTKRASAFTVFPMPTVPLVSFSSQPYVGCGKSYNYAEQKGGYSRKSSGQGRGQGRSAATATITKPKKARQPSLFQCSRTQTNGKGSRTMIPLIPFSSEK